LISVIFGFLKEFGVFDGTEKLLGEIFGEVILKWLNFLNLTGFE
jgi:hypothetical protein